MIEISGDEARRLLKEHHRTIDSLDAAPIHILAERFRCTQQVGRLEVANSMPPSDPEREERQIRRLRKLVADAGLDPVSAEKFLRFIVSEVIRHHERIADEFSH